MTAALLAIGMVIPLAVADAQPSNPPEQPTVAIYSINPSSAAAGEKVTIAGRDFATRNTVHFGAKSVSDVAIAWAVGINCAPRSSDCHPGVNQGLEVAVPADLAEGACDVSVENENGISNAVTLTVLGAGSPR